MLGQRYPAESLTGNADFSRQRLCHQRLPDKSGVPVRPAGFTHLSKDHAHRQGLGGYPDKHELIFDYRSMIY
jgi:hypothetical protein